MACVLWPSVVIEFSKVLHARQRVCVSHATCEQLFGGLCPGIIQCMGIVSESVCSQSRLPAACLAAWNLQRF